MTFFYCSRMHSNLFLFLKKNFLKVFLNFLTKIFLHVLFFIWQHSHSFNVETYIYIFWKNAHILFRFFTHQKNKMWQFFWNLLQNLLFGNLFFEPWTFVLDIFLITKKWTKKMHEMKFLIFERIFWRRITLYMPVPSFYTFLHSLNSLCTQLFCVSISFSSTFFLVTLRNKSFNEFSFWASKSNSFEDFLSIFLSCVMTQNT